MSLTLLHPWKLPYASPKNHPKKVGRKSSPRRPQCFGVPYSPSFLAPAHLHLANYDLRNASADEKGPVAPRRNTHVKPMSLGMVQRICNKTTPKIPVKISWGFHYIHWRSSFIGDIVEDWIVIKIQYLVINWRFWRVFRLLQYHLL